MALNYDGKTWLNLQEQVEKNKLDIFDIKNVQKILADYGIRVVGKVNTPNQLPNPLTYSGEYGDAFAVGESAPYIFFIFTRPLGESDYPEWLDVGQLAISGPQGAEGPQGPQGPEGESSKWISGTTYPAVSLANRAGDQYLNTTNGNIYEFNGSAWELKGTIKGPQGIQGLQGIQGPQGLPGAQGPQGNPGQNAFAVVIIGELESVNSLPAPTIDNRHDAYIIGNRLYVIMEDSDSSLIWQDVGFSDPGSRITVNGVYQGEYEMDQKLSKVSEVNKIYATDNTGAQIMLTYSENNDALSIAQRNTSGQINAAAPTSDTHVVNKKYAESKFVAINNITNSIYGNSDTGAPTNISYSATPGGGNIPLYNSNGNLNTNTPIDNSNAVNLGYFKQNTPTFRTELKANGKYTLYITSGE